MGKTKIDWTESVWNPVTGCSKISAGCKNCYAEIMTRRLKAMGQPKYYNGFDKVVCHESEILKPYQWKKGRMIFVNSMSDTFHADVTNLFIQRMFFVMNQNQQHTFQILTKRSSRMSMMNNMGGLVWSDNIWAGVTVENNEKTDKIDDLRNTRAKVKFLSCEPLLSALPDLDLTGIDWVIVGGESGPHARPMKEEWVIDIRDQCQKAGAPFFFKQWGGVNKKKSGSLLQGKYYKEMPKSAKASLLL
jgi:protein gp37